MESEENIALFDSYLHSEMDETARNAFEERLTSSNSFRKGFENYVAFNEDLTDGLEYESILQELGEIGKQPIAESSKQKIFFLKPVFLIPMGIAASLAFLLLIDPFGMTSKSDTMAGNYEPLEHQSADTYEDYQENQFTTTEAGYVNTDSQQVQNTDLIDSLGLIDFTPKGTAFLISNEGYFLTAKHLLGSREIFTLQEKTTNQSFEAKVVYTDSLMDFSILKCSELTARLFDKIPYSFVTASPELGEDVFTLGYPKKDVVYTRGVVSSETGFESDTLYFEVSLPSNAGHSGAPLFDNSGKLIGIVTAQQTAKQSVTYILKHTYILNKLESIQDSLPISLPKGRKTLSSKKMIGTYRPFIFELH